MEELVEGRLDQTGGEEKIKGAQGPEKEDDEHGQTLNTKSITHQFTITWTGLAFSNGFLELLPNLAGFMLIFEALLMITIKVKFPSFKKKNLTVS